MYAVTSLSLDEARRIALAAQGFQRPRPSRPGTEHIRRVIRKLGIVQLDFVTVVGPAHYQVLFSRLGPYNRKLLDRLLYTQHREFTEHWAHEASIVPLEMWRLLRYRRETYRVRPYGFEAFLSANPDYVEQALRDVELRGPLTAADLPTPVGTDRRIPNAWVTVPRAVLQAHFGRGLLAIARRDTNFTRWYDLTERVIPAEHLLDPLPHNEARRELLNIAGRAYGVATAADLADYFRMPVRDARPRIAELVEAGELIPVHVESWREPAYLHREAQTPRSIHAAALLSPFDPVVWFRPRARRLFEFDHRFEIFVPAEHRKWGVYVLPFLLGDRIVGRVDLKADRERSRLTVVAVYIEPHAKASAVRKALHDELRVLAPWLGLDRVESL